MIDFEINLPVEEWRWNMKNISLCSRHFFSFLQHEQMKDKGTAFTFHHMPCYVCSKIYSDPLNLKRKKKSTQNKKTVSHWRGDYHCIFMWMVYNKLMTVNQTKTMTLRINKIENGSIQTKGCCFSSVICFEKLLPNDHCINSISRMTKLHSDF